MSDSLPEARRFATEAVRYLVDNAGFSGEDLYRTEWELNGAAGLLEQLGHQEAVALLHRVITDLPSVPRLGWADQEAQAELTALLHWLTGQTEEPAGSGAGDNR